MKSQLVILFLACSLVICWAQAGSEWESRALEQLEAQRYSEAQALIQETLPSLQGQERLKALRMLAEIALNSDESEKAVGYLQEVSELEQKIHGERQLETEALWAEALELSGRKEEALLSYRRTVELAREQAGSYDTATALWNLSAFLYQEGRTEEALMPMVEAIDEYTAAGSRAEALEALEEMSQRAINDYGEQSPMALAVDLRKTRVLGEMGRYDEAIALGRSLLEPLRRSGDQTSLITALSNLGGNLASQGNYQEAAKAGEEALKLAQQTGEPEPISTASNNLAVTCVEMGDLRRARELYQQCLKTRLQYLAPDHPLVGVTRGNIGSLFLNLGNREDAKPELEAARKILALAGPEYSVQYAIALNALSDLSETLPEQLNMREDALTAWQRSLPPEHPQVGIGLSRVAQTLSALERPNEAFELCQKAHQIFLSAYGENHPHIATSLNQLASLKAAQGLWKEAEQLTVKALAIQEKTLPQRHADRRESLNQLARIKLAQNDPTTALEYARKAHQVRRSELEHALAMLSDFERQYFLESVRPFDLFCQLGSPTDILEASLSFKARAIDSQLEDAKRARTSRNPEAELTLAKLTAERARWSTLLARKGTTFPQLQAQLSKIEQLERELASLTRGKDQIVTPSLETVRAALTPSEVVLDFVQYRHQDGTDHLGAVVLQSAGTPKWVPLGPAEEVEKEFNKLARSMRRSRGEEVLLASCQELSGKIWEPLKSHFNPGVRSVRVSPTGDLNFRSFAVLVQADGSMVGETYSLTYVVSVRDLIPDSPTNPDRTLVLFGNPEFTNRPIFGMTFPPLPFSGQECEAVAEVAKTRGYRTSSWMGREASEERLRALRSPRLLHLATHGYFVRGTGLAGSGLVLTPSQALDGYCTAVEVASLDLQETELVVLSACNTGLGSEGATEVMGLRRAFRQAGARHLLMTLRPVSDETTSAFMQDFYRDYLESQDLELAFHHTQKSWLARVRKEQGLAAAERLIGPFVLSR